MAKSSSGGLTPMMKQYQTLRRSLPADVLLLFRLGDFYEMFFEDAKVAASILDVALTKRNGVPMCGVPHHAAQGYIARLIQAGKRAAIAEQTSDAVPGKLVDREITRLVSAGTLDDLSLLDARQPNHLAALCRLKDHWGLAWLDHSTGTFQTAQHDTAEAALDALTRLQPAELIVPDDHPDLATLCMPVREPVLTDGYTFLHDHAQHALTSHFRVQSLDGFGLGRLPAATCAAGALLHYLETQMRRGTDHLRAPRPVFDVAHVLIDAATQNHLELVSSRSGARHTLLHAVDRTKTAMGARLLRHWLLHPLRDPGAIEARQGLVQSLVDQPFIAGQLQNSFAEIRDMERTSARLSQGSGNARDLAALAQSLATLPQLRLHLEALAGRSRLAARLAPRLADFREVVDDVRRSLVDEPPAALRDGGLFRDGCMEELDELRQASSSGKRWLAAFQQQEVDRTGIKSLKIKYNAVFGYFIEVTKSNLDAVPEDYHRKQTTANAERFVTPALKEMEQKILGADERARLLEYQAFTELRDRVMRHLAAIQDAADAVATLDALAGLAETARHHRYVRPDITTEPLLDIRDGRHPVLDQTLTETPFVANDTLMDPEQRRLLLITGPNMAGKSTYIRQVALITLLAHTGSFVPAGSASIGLVDRIFTRIGASDDIARGQSTFMVEMNETAAILNNASERSLVILDEIGRGTSTFDGLSIAWAVAEHLHHDIRARTLFATHYHELTSLAASCKALANCNVAVREWNDQVIFLHKIVAGAADRSYGIQVARLAGLPDAVLGRAREVLARLERTARHHSSSLAHQKGHAAADGANDPEARPELPLFE